MGLMMALQLLSAVARSQMSQEREGRILSGCSGHDDSRLRKYAAPIRKISRNLIPRCHFRLTGSPESGENERGLLGQYFQQGMIVSLQNPAPKKYADDGPSTEEASAHVNGAFSLHGVGSVSD